MNTEEMENELNELMTTQLNGFGEWLEKQLKKTGSFEVAFDMTMSHLVHYVTHITSTVCFQDPDRFKGLIDSIIRYLKVHYYDKETGTVQLDENRAESLGIDT